MPTENLFKQLKKIKENKLHNKFKLLRDEPTLFAEKEILNEWFCNFHDRDNKIIKEFQTTFHSSFWEFYLNEVLLEIGATLDITKNRPDFMITEPSKLNIEAVVSNIKDTGIKESERNLDDQLSMLTPPYMQNDFQRVLNESITRCSSAINSKHKKHINEYSNCDWVEKDTPFAIALASYDQVNYGREHIYPMLALLYGYYYDHINDSYSSKRSIIKPGTASSIPISIFDLEEYRNIAAIIFSCTVTLGKLTSIAISKGIPSLNEVYNIRRDFLDSNIPYKLQCVSPQTPELLSDGIFVFHNPNAENPLPLDFFEKSNATQYFISNGTLTNTSNTFPIVSRFNSSKFFHSGVDMLVKENLRLYNRKSLQDFYE